MTDKPELKSCPFCGGEARWNGAGFMECISCEARGPIRPQNLLEAWNTRTASTAEDGLKPPYDENTAVIEGKDLYSNYIAILTKSPNSRSVCCNAPIATTLENLGNGVFNPRAFCLGCKKECNFYGSGTIQFECRKVNESDEVAKLSPKDKEELDG